MPLFTLTILSRYIIIRRFAGVLPGPPIVLIVGVSVGAFVLLLIATIAALIFLQRRKNGEYFL